VEREADIRLTEENVSEWEKYGVQIIRDFQVEKFREIAYSLYPKFEDQFGKENMRWIRILADRPK
jgi:TRAP-type C4-dicarboxylate transport system substrate-binding protein